MQLENPGEGETRAEVQSSEAVDFKQKIERGH